MSVHTVALSLAYTGAALGVSMVVPQILRTLRHPSLGGVSPLAWGLSALACLTWLAYGVRTSTFPQIPGNVLLVSGSVVIVLLVPASTTRTRRALVLASSATLVLLFAFAVPASWVGYLAFAVGLVSAWPQVYDSVVGWRRGGASGVSISAWSIRVASQACWLAYALVAGDGPVALSATAALSTAAGLVAVESSRRSLDGQPASASAARVGACVAE